MSLALLPHGAEPGANAAPPPARNELRRALEIIFPACLVFALQGGSLLALMRGDINMLAYICFHAAAVLLAMAWAYAFRRGGHFNRFAVLLAVVSGALGAVGTIGLIIIVPLQIVLRRRATPFHEWYAALFPDEQEDSGEALYRQIASGRQVGAETASVVSFSDVMRAGTLEQKRSVIALLVKQFRPEFAPALRLALQDPTPAIRVQAATAVSEIESDFLERSMHLADLAQRKPKSLDAQLALAQHYDAYAFSGLLDAQRERENRAAALQAYQAALQLAPEHAGIRTAISRILVREARYAEAVEWLGHRLDSGKVSRSLVAWYAECLFHLRRWGELQGVIQRFSDLLLGQDEDGNQQNDAIAKVAQLWLGTGKPA